MPVDLEFYILNTPPSLWKKQMNKQTNKQTEHLEDRNLKV